MPTLSTEVKRILQRIDEIDRQRVALWRRRERLIARLERLECEEKSHANSMPFACGSHADSNAELCQCNADMNAKQNDVHR